jgi:RNA polymerase sigma-70 factor, ECF subfamily
LVSDPSSLPDHELVAAALRDRNAFALIARRWRPVLARYVCRMLGQSAAATDDLLQDIFVKIYVNLNGFDTARPFGPWVYRIARNETLNYIRKGKSEPRFVSGEDAQLILDQLTDGTTAQDVAERACIEDQVRSAITSLDLRYHDVLVLRFLEDKGYDEIAEIMHVPPGTVAALISRGTKQLRSSLEAIGLKAGQP